jgi:hypothetical protein
VILEISTLRISPKMEVPLVSSTPATASHNGATASGGERKMMTNLIKRPPALLQYTDLVYTVREKSGKFGSSWFATKTILKGKRLKSTRI